MPSITTNLHDADETEVEVEYTIERCGNGWDEPYTVEVEIVSVEFEGEEVALLEDEYEAITNRIAETDEGPDYGDYDEDRDD